MNCETASLRELWLQGKTDAQINQELDALTPFELEALYYDWKFNARQNQLIPTTDWDYWLILAGRGFGKTRTGAETVRQWVKHSKYVNLIGATADDARDIMIQGESGILAVCPKYERPEYKKNESKLVWPNGAESLIFTADAPERLRGKQHEKVWADELCAWRYVEAFDQAKFGMRLGKQPQMIITTTPKPTKLLKEIIKDERTCLTRGSTYDNKMNLAANFLKTIVATYEGTRLGRQELNAEILDDVQGALWTWAMVESAKSLHTLEPTRTVIGVDPAVTNREDSDLTGIVVASKTADSKYRVHEDASMRDSPNAWAQVVINLYERYDADAVVVETNQGGDLIKELLRRKGFNGRIIEVHASKGKFARAEPISALYEQGLVSHDAKLDLLESELTEYSPMFAKKSPDRLDALVWALTELSGKRPTEVRVRRL